MPATSATRVADHTEPRVNEAIERRTEMNIEYFERHPEQINRRLAELDREWDIERMLATNSSILSLAGLVFSITRRRSWVLLPLTVQAFFLQHALSGWCPPLGVLRRMGYRTPDEINRERNALLKLRKSDASPRKKATNSR